jgi:CubicO group peptidase (beta-lactamase class C family)
LISTTVIDPKGGVNSTGTTDIVPWWSFTKTVLATALLRLSEEQEVHLHDPIAGCPYTPAHLLRHEAGLPDYGMLQDYQDDVARDLKPWSPDELLRRVEAERLLFPPGEGWAYSNVGYLKVAQIIERATGDDLGNALHDLVFAPAGLSSARVAVAREDLEGVCMGRILSYHPGWVYHGLAVGTTSDAALFLRSLLSGHVLRPETLDLMLNAQPLPQYRSENHRDPAYGLGLMMSATDIHQHPIGHSGGGPGSRIAVYAKQDAVCAIWSSSELDPESEMRKILGM